MKKILYLHDLHADDAEKFFTAQQNRYTVFAPGKGVKPCRGCFGCWVKTPGKCVIQDQDSDFASLLPQADVVIIISRLVFGGFSPDVKAIIDRSIGFILPFFCYRQGEMHHRLRYKKSPSFHYYFYGHNIPEAEKTTAQKLAKANALNWGADEYGVNFYHSIEEMQEALS